MFSQIRKELPQMTIEVIEERDYNLILITQTQEIVYNELHFHELRKYQNTVTNIIYSIWNNKCYFKVRGNSKFANKHKKTRFKLQFKIIWSTSPNSNWKVYIHRKDTRSYVRQYAREIHFDLFDIDLQEKIGSDGNILQYPVAHEFGHTIGLVKFSRPLLSFNPNYPWGTLHADEYETNSSKENKFRRPFINDRRSIMNIGNELRERHMDYILQELNTLLLGTEFYISTLLK